MAWIRSVLTFLNTNRNSLFQLLFSGLVFGIISMWYGCEQDQKIAAVASSVSTQYLGLFPNYMPTLNKILENAEENDRGEILIAADVPGYALYSQHTQYENYARILKQKRTKNAVIHMIVQNETKRHEVLEAQFSRKTLDQIKKTNEYEEFLRWSGRLSSQITTKEALIATQDEEQMGSLTKDFHSIAPLEYACDMPMHLWIVDNQVAIFSIPNLSQNVLEGAVEGAFITRDGNLIKQLRSIFDSYSSGSGKACK